MKSECVGLYEKGTVAKKVVFGIGEIVLKTEVFRTIILADKPQYFAQLGKWLYGKSENRANRHAGPGALPITVVWSTLLASTSFPRSALVDSW